MADGGRESEIMREKKRVREIEVERVIDGERDSISEKGEG